MEVETAVRRHVKDDQTIAGYVGDRIWKHRLRGEIAGTGQRALVIARNGEWSIADPVNTPHYPLVEVQAWADSTRNPDGTIATEDAEDNAWALMNAVDALMHNRRGEMWGDLMVVSSARWSEGHIIEADIHRKGAGCVLATRKYALETA